MSLRPEPLPPIPDVTAAAVRAAVLKGNVYVDLRACGQSSAHSLTISSLPISIPLRAAPWKCPLGAWPWSW
jgi:hypothetical protein